MNIEEYIDNIKNSSLEESIKNKRLLIINTKLVKDKMYNEIESDIKNFIIEFNMSGLEYDIEPKRIRFVYPKMNRDSHVLLVEGMYKGKKGLKIEPPLYAHNDDGSYSNEVRRMFGEKIDE